MRLGSLLIFAAFLSWLRAGKATGLPRVRPGRPALLVRLALVVRPAPPLSLSLVPLPAPTDRRSRL